MQRSEFKSTLSKVFRKKGVLKNFAKKTGKNLRRSLFFIKFEVQSCNSMKKETPPSWKKKHATSSVDKIRYK